MKFRPRKKSLKNSEIQTKNNKLKKDCYVIVEKDVI